MIFPVIPRDFGSLKQYLKQLLKKNYYIFRYCTGIRYRAKGGGGGLSSDHSFGYIYRAYENNFADNGKVTLFETEDLGVLFDDYGGEWLLKAMREAVRQKKKSLAYVRGTLEGYRKRGGPETERRMDRASPAEAEVQEDDPITILMRKADEQRLAEYGVT